LPLSRHATALSGRPRRIKTASKMRLTTSGGDLSALSAVMSFGWIELSASKASSSAGCAAARSAAASSRCFAILAAVADTSATIAATPLRSRSASAVDSPIDRSIFSASAPAAASSAVLAASSTRSLPTSSLAEAILASPESTACARLSAAAHFFA
jgi:hypothetical protein